jgi:hypothetical protein
VTDARAASRFGPYVFALTEDEARIAAARAGLRRALSGRLGSAHLAPLAVFALAVAFATILAMTGLIGRRAGEIALLLAAAGFLIQRLATLRRFAAARRASRADVEAMRAAGPLTLSVDETGLALGGADAPRRWKFAECVEAEDAGGLIYLWPRAGSPAIAPTRVFAAADDAAGFLEFLRARIAAPPRSLQNSV